MPERDVILLPLSLLLLYLAPPILKGGARKHKENQPEKAQQV